LDSECPPASGGKEDHVAVQMRALAKKSLDAPDETRDLSGMGKVEVVKIGELTVSRSTFKPGWRWSEHVKPIVGGDSCQVLHHSFVISGRLGVRSNDGSEEEYRAGDVWVIQPGHDAWVVGEEPVVSLDFAPTAATYAKPR
jgi:quercetin dioxygenase-like cupin family protein